MTNEELKTKLTEIDASVTFDETGEWLNVFVEPLNWLPLAKKLKYDVDLSFDYMFCLTCVDFKTHFNMVYHITSTQHRHTIVVKSKLDHKHPEIESVAHIWRTADFHEREVFDLFGITFLNHPDLRRILLTDDWVGYPLRKDYDDPVNIIKL